MTRIWVKKCNGFDEEHEADREFWGRVAPDDRVVALEELRAQWWKTRGERDQGLRRTVRVFQRPPR